MSTAPMPSATAVTMRTPTHDPQARLSRNASTARSSRSCWSAGHEHRDGGVGQRSVRVVRERRRLGGRVVADEQHRAAVGSGAHEVGVLQHVAAPVEPRALAVPGADDAVDVGVRHGLAHLRAPHGRRGQLLVQPGLVEDAVGGQSSGRVARWRGRACRAATRGSPTRTWRCRARRPRRAPAARPAPRTRPRRPTAAVARRAPGRRRCGRPTGPAPARGRRRAGRGASRVVGSGWRSGSSGASLGRCGRRRAGPTE